MAGGGMAGGGMAGGGMAGGGMAVSLQIGRRVHDTRAHMPGKRE